MSETYLPTLSDQYIFPCLLSIDFSMFPPSLSPFLSSFHFIRNMGAMNP